MHCIFFFLFLLLFDFFLQQDFSFSACSVYFCLSDSFEAASYERASQQLWYWKHTQTHTRAHAHTKTHANKDINTCFEDLRQVATLGENFLSTLRSYSAHRAEAQNLWEPRKHNTDSVKSKTICQRFSSQPSVICMYLLCVRECLISNIFLLRHLWNLKIPYWSFCPGVWAEAKHRAAVGPQAPPTRFTLDKSSESTGRVSSIQNDERNEIFIRLLPWRWIRSPFYFIYILETFVAVGGPVTMPPIDQAP